MKKLQLMLLIMAGFTFSATAQNEAIADIKLNSTTKCGFDAVLKKMNYPYVDAMINYKEIVKNATSTVALSKTSGTVYQIPVVFHVVYSQATPTFNIPDSILINQIDVLNKAYRNTHTDTGNTRSIFKPLAADAEIQFYLATTDPNGASTTGITRTISTRSYFGSAAADLDSMERVKMTSQGGIDPWPANKYLNIWVANLTDAQGQLSVLGYAIPPLNPIPPNWPAGAGIGLNGLIDGVVLQPHSVGSNNPLSTALQGMYTKGRCAVHEVGHYLGLMHTFGSGDGQSTANCGVIADDGMADTPEQSLLSFTTGCPSPTKNSCGSGASDQPDMWENYMDYTTDACQTMLTLNQVTLIRSVMANQRATLNNPTTDVKDQPHKTRALLFPNPTNSSISIDYSGKISNVKILNFMGQTVKSITGASANKKQYDVTDLIPGNYLMTFDCDNGKTLTGKCSIAK